MNTRFSIEQLKDELFMRVFSHIPTSSAKIKKTPKRGLIIDVTPEFEQERYNISYYARTSAYDRVICEFYHVLEDNFQHCDLSAFYKNLQTLKVKSRRINLADIIAQRLTGTISPGEYNVKLNKMNLLNDDNRPIRGITNHELLHMASTKHTEDTIFCGFAQINKESKEKIGNALNEGYTEYLNKKYFNNTLESTYSNEMVLSQGIELIIGSKKMEELYFSADLNGLIEELSKYTTRENAESIITQMDEVEKDKRKPEFKQKEYREVRQQIASIYLEQQQQLLEQGHISEETYYERKLMYADVFVTDNMALPEGAILTNEKNMLKVIGNTGVITLDPKRYETTKNQNIEVVGTHK